MSLVQGDRGGGEVVYQNLLQSDHESILLDLPDSDDTRKKSLSNVFP